MGVHQFNGVYVGEQSGALFYDISAAGDVLVPGKNFSETPPPDIQQLVYGPWHPWGTDNVFPITLKKMIDDCGELQAIIKAKATFAVNRGVLPVKGSYNAKGEFVIDEVIDDPEINEFLDESNIYDQLYAMLKDQYGYGNFSGRFALTLAGDKIARIRRDDVTEMRYKKLNDSNKIDTVYLCSEWGLVSSATDESILDFPLIDMSNAQESLKAIVKKGDRQIAFTGREPDNDTKYYSEPDWYAARGWVNINIGVPKMKAAMYENSMRPKYIVKVHESFWAKFVYIDPETGNSRDFTYEEKRQMREAWFTSVDTYLAGSSNAYKSIWTEFFVDMQSGNPIDYIKIEPVEDKSFDGELLKDSSTSGSMIAFAMGWNPAINGGSLPSGPYTNSQGGSNVRESTLLQVMMAEPERRRLIRILNIVAKYNGWMDTYKGFKWVISSTIPTTLDTGGSSAPAVQGQ